MAQLTFAQRKMRNYIGKKFTGSLTSRDKNTKRSMIIALAIYQRFGVHIFQYQLKHLLWFTEVYLYEYAYGTRYNYHLTILKLLNMNTRYVKWKPIVQFHFKKLIPPQK